VIERKKENESKTTTNHQQNGSGKSLFALTVNESHSPIKRH
jgi:hypothetical protein